MPWKPWWPADEYIFIKLCIEKKLDEFYKEAEHLIQNYLKQKGFDDTPFLHEAFILNRNLIKMPFQNEDLRMQMSTNVGDVYLSALQGEQIPLVNGNFWYHIDRLSASWKSWDDWLRKVVWYGNKRGDYLYYYKGHQNEKENMLINNT